MKKWARLLYQPGVPLYGDTRITGSREHIAVSKRAAEEGMVLLKNNGTLPLPAGKNLALIGKASVDYVKGGGGSGDVFCKYIHSLYDGLKLRNVSIYEPLIRYYEEEMDRQHREGLPPGMTEEVEIPDELLEGAGKFTDTAIVMINRYSGEGWDRSDVECNNEYNPWPEETNMPKVSGKIFPDGDFYLTGKEKKMIAAATAGFDKVVVVLNIGGVMDLKWAKEDEGIDSVLIMGQAGMEGGDAAADILLGTVNPSGRLTDTFAGALEDYPSTEGFHESFDYVDYNEDIYVGYRYFETVPGASKKVVYPFGYGLSYTSFETVLLGTAAKDGETVFTIRVTNSGKMAGKEAVGLYYEAPCGLLGKPARALADFAKTKLLAPGESQILTLAVNEYEMASFDDLGKIKEAAYVLEKGTYSFYIGANVRDAVKTDYVYVNPSDRVIKQLSHKAAPVSLKKRMLSDGSYEELPTGEDRDINECIFEKMQPGTEEALAPGFGSMPIHSLLDPFRKDAKPFPDVAEGKCTVRDFIARMTDDDLMRIVGGQPNTGVGNVFSFGNNPELGIPAACTADGPAGVRIAPETGVWTTAFPCATTIACTWNKELAEEIGFTGGEEIKENNLSVWLTPAVNIHRNPMCGRNFEYYSEDPCLTGKMASALVRGIQRNHVGASVKHFACNNKETNRKHSDSRVSERALREIYLRAFEIIVRESAPYTIMSSYNAINGFRASENRDLLTGILRDEWNYEGLVTSDWWTRGEHYKEVNAGNDLKMGTGFPDRLKKAMEMGALDRNTLEVSAERILNTILKFD